jgi:hypothetical protein
MPGRSLASLEALGKQILQKVPTGCTIGITQACLLQGSSTPSGCRHFPIKDFLPRGIASVSLVEKLIGIVPCLDVFIIAGLALVSASTLIITVSLHSRRAQYVSFGLSVVGFICLLVFGVFTLAIAILVKGLVQAGSCRYGDAYVAAIGNVVSSFVHLIISVSTLRYGRSV